MEVYLPEGVILNYKITACEQVSTNSAVYKITEEGHEAEPEPEKEFLLSTCSAKKHSDYYDARLKLLKYALFTIMDSG